MLPLFKHGAYCRPLKNGACCPPFNVVHAALLSRMVHVVLVNSCKGTTFTSLQCLASSIKLSQGAGTHPEHNRRVPCSCPCLCSALTWQMRADEQHAALAILCSQQLWPALCTLLIATLHVHFGCGGTLPRIAHRALRAQGTLKNASHACVCADIAEKDYCQGRRGL